MKTYGHLYPRVWAFENLYAAYRAARKGKRGKPPAASFERRGGMKFPHSSQQVPKGLGDLSQEIPFPGDLTMPISMTRSIGAPPVVGRRANACGGAPLAGEER